MAAEERLDRIEKKLDTMAEAIVSLARMEERMVTLLKRMDNYDTTQNQLSERLRKIETNVGSNGQMLRFAERVFWIVVSAGVAYLFTSRGG